MTGPSLCSHVIEGRPCVRERGHAGSHAIATANSERSAPVSVDGSPTVVATRQSRLPVLLILGVLIVALAGFAVARGSISPTGGSTSGGASEPAPAPGNLAPGNPAVYQRIAAETDCATLHADFDQAAANHDAAAPGSEQATWSTNYMAAADARMRQIGCS